MRRPQLRNKIRRIVPRIICQYRRYLPQRTTKRLRRDRLLAFDLPRLLLHRTAHQHLRAPASKHRPRLFHRLGKYRQRIMQRPLRLIHHLRRRPTQHNRARLARSNARKLDKLPIHQTSINRLKHRMRHKHTPCPLR